MIKAILLAVASTVAGRTFTVQNSCSFTVWPAIFTDLNAGSSALSTKTGWEAPGGSEFSFTVPENWKSGRIWARTGCDFTNSEGIGSCVTGGCLGGLQCDANVVAHPPVTYAEFTLNNNGQDHYDVSLVGGFNLPIRISNTAGCGYAECTVNLNEHCPEPLKVPIDPNGTVAACKVRNSRRLGAERASSGVRDRAKVSSAPLPRRVGITAVPHPVPHPLPFRTLAPICPSSACT
ncbi:pathogenesis-related protein PR5K (thaumatin family) [Rhizoctonia solani]|uniref:Pathogenesis-related protein PR5K (Thaumatin family) n=1 Tax=Rhizoctonia solani TaxID=456999 RepID=A0A8H8NQ35_9AGAM|nr:pathogenesis-related protein PR5K (thaumatin family) [Rhizoctonia solani]QRW16653.1 pathogenesis-related protein PR5K (thaumatin family) [Rhizoctonia solani]